MVRAPASHDTRMGSRLKSWLGAPLTPWWCVIGWFVATAIFLGLVALFGGPSHIDSRETLYGTWAVAHGQIACAYPSVSIPGQPPPAPLYLLLSGGIAAIAQIGHGVPFPSAAALGPHCDKAFSAMDRWSLHVGAVGPTLWIGCVGWLALLVGVVAWLRTVGRGRRGWEPATLFVVACLLPVWMCVQSFFHPQDLVAMGLALCAMACAGRGRWVGAGVLIVLAVLAQQFALLVAVPLLVLAPANRRVPFAAAGLATGALVVLPLMALTSGHALTSVALGTGGDYSVGGTVLWHLHLSGTPAVLLTRVAPVAVSLALSWWLLRRIGPAALEPTNLISVVAVSLSLRLVFEQNLIQYYFMALGVALILLDVTRGRVRTSVVAWLLAMSLVICSYGILPFGAVGWGRSFQDDLPLVVVASAAIVVLVRVRGGRGSGSTLAWLALAVCGVLTVWPPGITPVENTASIWFWQLLIVIPGILLASEPLLRSLRRARAELPLTTPSH